MREIQFREALREALNEEMRKNDKIFLMGEEVAEYNGAYKVSQGMLDEFGAKRIIDTPIAELGFAGISIGAAMNGLSPIVEFMTFNFSLVAIDQVINAAAKVLSMSGGQFSCPIVFRGPTGNAGQLGAQHSQNFDNWYANCPGLKVVVPSTPYDAKGLLKQSILDPDPVIFMESEVMYGDKGEVPEEEYYLPIGKANIVKEGTDVTIVTFGKMLSRVVMPAIEDLNKEVTLFWTGDQDAPRTLWYVNHGVKIEKFLDTGDIVIHNTMTNSDHYEEVTEDQYMIFRNLGWEIGCCCVNIDVIEYRMEKASEEQLEKLNAKKISYLKKLSTYLQTLIK
jgi:pyruvate/2-oxoglutarate/acetoin dehydrogenase E1 component